MNPDLPLYSTLKDLAKQTPLRLHIPGHKGKHIVGLRNLLPLDFTEINGTGNLYQVGEPFTSAQNLWAQVFGFPHCQFLTGGSTQAVSTALALSQGGGLLLDRLAHRSAYNAMGLLDLDCHYLSRPWLEEEQVAGAVDPQEVDRLLRENPHIKTVFLTSPTLYGVMSDVYSIAQVVHEHGGKLLVDGAHGAHLPWLMIDHFSGADVVAVSAHKTLPALGQSALLFYRDYDPQMVADTASLFGTSSPSYPILASMDLAREFMNGEGMEEYVRVARQVATLREIFPSLQAPRVVDPTRLCLLCPQGREVAKHLETEGIYFEMATNAHLVGVFTCQDEDDEFEMLGKALAHHFQEHSPLPDLSPPTSFPERAISLRQAIFSQKISLPIQESQGRIAAMHIAPYPPGVPVVAMGEVITAQELAYLQRVGYEESHVLVVAE